MIAGCQMSELLHVTKNVEADALRPMSSLNQFSKTDSPETIRSAGVSSANTGLQPVDLRSLLTFLAFRMGWPVDSMSPSNIIS
jgi:hypothetical protein